MKDPSASLLPYTRRLLEQEDPAWDYETPHARTDPIVLMQHLNLLPRKGTYETPSPIPHHHPQASGAKRAPE